MFISSHENSIFVIVADLVMVARENALDTTKSSKVISLRYWPGDSPAVVLNQHILLTTAFSVSVGKSPVYKIKSN